MSRNTSEGSEAIKRWSESYNNDFAARIDRSIANQYSGANQHPIVVLISD